MKYLCLIYDEEKVFDQMPAPDRDAVMAEYRALGADLRESGHFVSGARLAPVASATTVRVRDDRLSVTDGPFAETKEQLGGFFLIEAADLNEAIQVAKRIPSARFGSIEVRPLIVPPGAPGINGQAAPAAKQGAPA